MNTANRWTWFRRIALGAFFTGVAVILSLLVLYTWLHTYPDDVDPKNIYYVLWKRGLNNNMNLDSALVAMSHDVWPVRQVQGLSKEQLKARFGFIKTLDEASPYLRGCYATPTATGGGESQSNQEEVAFLRDGPWMVVMKGGKVVDLVMCKGY